MRLTAVLPIGCYGVGGGAVPEPPLPAQPWVLSAAVSLQMFSKVQVALGVGPCF